MEENYDADIQMLVSLIPEVMRSYRQTMFARYQKSDLTPVQWMLLAKLAKEGPCNASQIGTMMGITSGSVTSVTERLITRQLIERRRHETDRRIVIFTLTDAGKQALQTIHDEQRAQLTLLSQKLGPDKTRALLSVLRDIKAVLQETVDETTAN